MTSSLEPVSRIAGFTSLVTLVMLMSVASESRGQSALPAVFVANNGNLEGSVTAFTVNRNGTLAFVNRVITGVRTTTTQPCAGCNAYEISLSPSGQYLASAHPAGDLDGITIFTVASSAAITQVFQLPLPAGQGGPLDLAWLSDTALAVTRLDPSPDQIIVYTWNPAGPSLNFLQATPVGTSLGYLAVHPSGQYLYANDSGAADAVFAFSVAPNGTLTQIDMEPSGLPFALELAVSRDGMKLYAACGISNGGDKVLGFNIAPNGTLSRMTGSPFVSPGDSPSNVFVNDDDSILVVGHGTDATARTFAIDPAGALTSTGVMFDVGLQGTLGDVRVANGLVFVTDNSTAIDGIMGIYSFTLGGNGSLTQNGPITLTQGIAPRSIATWIPPAPDCPADINGSGGVDIDDLLAVINAWGPCPAPCPADVDGSGTVNIDDLLAVINGWGACR